MEPKIVCGTTPLKCLNFMISKTYRKILQSGLFWWYATHVKAVLPQTLRIVNALRMQSLMITLSAQGPSLQRRTKVPCSCQNTADSSFHHGGDCPSDRLQVSQLPQAPSASTFRTLWHDPEHTLLPGTIRDMGTGRSSSAATAPTAFWQQAARLCLPSVLWAKGAGCLGWPMPTWNPQSHSGTVCKRLWDTAGSLLALIAMAIVGSSPLSMFSFNGLDFYILNPWFHRLHGLSHAI